MKRTSKITVGIDVTESRICMVVLRRTAAGSAVWDTATAPVPAHVIEEGRITDPRALAKALKAVRRRRCASAGAIAISLPPQATLTRILPLAEQDPQRIGQFVRDEIKQYAVLSGREAASDFRVLSAARQDTRGSVLVAAADHENVTALTTACHLAGLPIGIIEPPALACARLLGADRGSAADQGLMVVLLKGATLTLCVFRRGLLDFVRTELLAPDPKGPDAGGRRIVEEVAAVMRFYSLRGSEAVQEWKVVLADDDHSAILAPVQAALAGSAASGSVSVVAAESLPAALAIDLRGHRDVSLTALGLASRADAAGECGSSVNLLPAKVGASRCARKNMFVMANAAALLMLTVIVGTGVVAYLGRRIQQNVITVKQQALRQGTHTLPALVDEMAYIDERLKKLSEEVMHLEDIGKDHWAVNWVQFLTDVQNAVPPHRVLRLEKLTLEGEAVVTLSGLATSTNAVQAFVDALNASPEIRRASRREWSTTSKGLVKYEIQCILSAGKVS